MTGRVVHCKREPYDIYIGRPSRWGNPFQIGGGLDRSDVIAMYREWIADEPGLLADVHKLAGKVLGCWCRPAECHGDVLLELAEASGPALRTEGA